ncbi:MAG: type II toxin-antitoxin system HipA family toxin [Bacteroidales bacterium]|jgi:serine/threonine-protein kinase HipA|nr:type II toxin-antitoxin system HipA family toxin [Bacteroidales bacterium]
MNSLKIIYKGQFVGVCDLDNSTDRIFFQYHPDFLKTDIQLSPLLLPLENEVFEFDKRTYNPETFKGLPPMIADSLPDDFGNKMFIEWLQRSNISQHTLNSLEKLCYVGNRGMGALEYEPAMKGKQRDSNIDIADLLEIANKIYFKRENDSVPLNDYHQSLSTLLRIGSSVGGARAKALIAINEDTQEIKAGDILHKGNFKYYLIKFDGLKNGIEIEPNEYGILEYIYHKMAKDAGIVMTDSTLLKENGRSHFMTERFDRPNGEKIHTQSLCALTGIDFRQPYQIDYEDIFRVLNYLKTDYRDKDQLFRRMVFNVLAFNHDDHTKNFTFIYRDNKWELSPAYDIIFSYSPDNYWLKKHNIKVNGKTEEITEKDILIVAEKVGIKSADSILKEVANVVSEFVSYAEKYKFSKNKTLTINEILQSGIK